MIQALWFLLETVGSLLATACVLRAYMNRLGLGVRNPVGQFVVAVTDWIVRPLRGVLPARGRTDWASIAAAFLLALLLAVAYVLLFASPKAAMAGFVIALALWWLVKWSLWLLMALVLVQAVLSWVNPHAPIAPTVNAFTRPFLAPIRRVVPLVGGVDLSPLVLIVLAQLLLTLLGSLLPAMLSMAS